MSVEQWAVLAGILTGLAGAGTALYQARLNHRAGVSSNEQSARRDEAEDRRDTIADRDSLLATVLTEVRDLRDRVERAERARRVRDDHIDALEHHIWQRMPPPPPARPEGI